MQVKDILDVEQQRLGALRVKNFEVLATLLAPTLTYIHSNGKVDDREAVIAKLHTPFRYLELKRRDLQVHVYDERSAVMTGVLDVEFSSAADAPSQTMSVMVTQVWIKLDGRIQMAAYHVSKISN